MSGDQIRDDGFFTLEDGRRRPSEEAAEAVLVAVRDEAEARKVRYLGYLLANLIFEPAVDARTAHATVAEAEDLTYTQFCLLALVKRKQQFPLPPSEGQGEIRDSWEAVTVRNEFHDLGFTHRALMATRPSDTGLSTKSLSFLTDTPCDQELRGRGELLVALMELEWIPDEDLLGVERVLWQSFGHELPG
jgi:hypothetical protein